MVRANPRGFSSLLAAARGVTGGSPPPPRRSRERVPLHAGDGRAGLRSGGMLREREAPGLGDRVPPGASPAPARRRSVGAGDGLLDGALLIDATSMTRVEVRHDLVIAGRRCLHRLADPATSRSTGWRPALHTHCTTPLESLCRKGFRAPLGPARPCSPVEAAPGHNALGAQAGAWSPGPRGAS